MSASVLVSDGEERSSLAAVRSLGRRGYRVYVCSKDGSSLAGASRFALADRSVPCALLNPSEFAAAIQTLIREWQIDVFLPMTELSLNAVYANTGMFEGVCIPSATREQFRSVSDKNRILAVAAACGLKVPEQVVLSAPADLSSIPEAELRFPLVVKPSRSVVPKGEGQAKLGVIHCEDVEHLRRAMAKLPLTAYPLLLQQRVIGPGVGVFLLLWDGDLVATFAHRRLREKPPSGGVSVYRESIRVDQSVIDRSRRLLDSFGWRGVAMIEYKLDEASGVPVIMEINGRFWGSLQLAIDAGVDFPSLLVARALGQKVYGPASYKVGIRSRWEWGGVDYLLARLRRSDAELSLPAGGPGRIRSVLSALLPWLPGDRLEVLRLGDPRPFLRETAQYFRRSTRRRASAT